MPELNTTIIGTTFGHWTVLGVAPKSPNNSCIRYLCMCECGTEKSVQRRHLNSGLSASCGCHRYDNVVTHGQTRGSVQDVRRNKTYKSWVSMIARCHGKSSKACEKTLRNYKDRGISVCDRWRYSYADFLSDMGERPSPAFSIDRINNDGNYEPGNCRWATKKEQCRNTSRTVKVCFRGEIRPLIEWCEILEVRRSLIYQRLRNGWSIDRAFTAP